MLVAGRAGPPPVALAAAADRRAGPGPSSGAATNCRRLLQLVGRHRVMELSGSEGGVAMTTSVPT